MIDAETQASEQYREIIRHSEETGDRVTADMATRLQADEEAHRTLFEGLLAALESESHCGATR